MAELIRTIMSIFKPRDYGAEAEALSKRIQQSEAALPIGWCGDGPRAATVGSGTSHGVPSVIFEGWLGSEGL